MATLRVIAFKNKRTYYAEEVFDIKGFPTAYSVPNETTVDQLRKLQSKFTFDLWNDIVEGRRDDLSPVTRGFRGFTFVFMAEFDDSEAGFLTYMLDRENEI